MSSVQERLQLKRVPLDTWNIREQLCLASAVVRSGDQNWMSVSRALKTVGEANRPPDWYSQKSCAAQYGALLEHVETPKRKKRSSEGAVETPQESILKRLTQDRIVEIQKTVAELNQHYEQLKNDVTEARNPATSDDRLREMWTEIETAKRTRERETARRAAWLKEREERRAKSERTWRPPHAPHASPPSSHSGNTREEGVSTAPAPPSSPLLTSLLKSSPVVTTPQHISHPANVVETVSPSAGAPTLSMLLEKPGGGSSAPAPPAGPPAPPAPPVHDNKHAAIEHIKSQLVQIEQQLKASASPPLTAPPPAPTALDIDDIEIKAEDVYAFRDVDIHIPPVTPIHKPVNRIEMAPLKTDEHETPEMATPDTATQQLVAEIKEEPMAAETVSEELVPVDVETLEPSEPLSAGTEQLANADSDVSADLSASGAANVSAVEMRFPAPEIKVLGATDQIKEEVKEVEAAPREEKKEPEDEEVNVEDIKPVIEEQSVCMDRVPTPPVSAPVSEEVEAQETPGPEEQPVVDPADIPLPTTDQPPLPAGPEEQPVVDPADIPLPATDQPPLPSDPPLPSEPEVLQATAEAPPVPEVPEPATDPETNADVTTDPAADEKIPEDKEKKDDVEEIPLKEMVREESAALPEPEAEVKEEPRPETEETHTETDDDTPMELSREEEKDGKKKRDYSRKKKPDSRTCSGSESAPESPGGLSSEADREFRKWKKSVMVVFSRLCAHKYASLFLRAISDEEAPGYSVVVKKPIDLSTIRRKLDSGVIRTTSELQRDIMLMLTNALMYNSSEHSVYVMAKEMFVETVADLKILVAAHAHAGLDGAPPSPAPAPAPAHPPARSPARRKRRREGAGSTPPPPPPPPPPPHGLAKRPHAPI